MGRVIKSLYDGWRVIATGVSFALFGLGGPVIALVLAILLYCVPISSAAKCKIARNTLKLAFKLYIQFMRCCGLLTYEVRGLEEAPLAGRIVIANHPSLLDVVFIMSLVRDCNCVVKQGLFKNIFTRPPILAAKYICNSSTQLLPESVASLKTGVPLILFPEGTRSEPGKPLVFQRGAANIALAAKCDISPVLIRCTPPTLMKGQKWYDIAPSRPHFLIDFQPLIPLEPYLQLDEPPSKVARMLTRDLVDYFTNKLNALDESVQNQPPT